MEFRGVTSLEGQLSKLCVQPLLKQGKELRIDCCGLLNKKIPADSGVLDVYWQGALTYFYSYGLDIRNGNGTCEVHDLGKRHAETAAA